MTVHVDAQMLVLRVADHGPGLPAAIREMMTEIPAELRPRVTEDNGSGLRAGDRATHDTRAGRPHRRARQPRGRRARSVPAAGAWPRMRSHPHPRSTIPTSSKWHAWWWTTTRSTPRSPWRCWSGSASRWTMPRASPRRMRYARPKRAPTTFSWSITVCRTAPGWTSRANCARTRPARRPHLPAQRERGMGQAGPADARLFVALLKKPLDAASLAQAIHEGCDRRPTDLLEGLSPGAAPDGRGLRRELVRFPPGPRGSRTRFATTTSPGVPTTGQRRKIFGLTRDRAVLLQVEWSHTDPAADIAARAAAEALLGCALPTGWPGSHRARQA